MAAAERYDVVIIGAGPDGLAAAALLARKGLSVIVLERAAEVGGRAATREFHHGFFASPYADALAPIPAEIFRDLELARLGAIALSPTAATEHPSILSARRRSLAHALEQARKVHKRGWLQRPEPPAPWPVPEFAALRLADAAPPEMLAEYLEGCVADPFLAGSALHLLVPPPSFATRGGLCALGAALGQAATQAGAEISLGLDVTDIQHRGGRVTGVHLADGTSLTARAILSTLDVKRSFLSLFTWSDLPKALVDNVVQFRMAGGMARLLLALKSPPRRFRGAIRLNTTPEHYAAAESAWRSGALAGDLPMTLRMPSVADPSLAPAGMAVLAVTVSGVPYRPFDGNWNHDKRARLTEHLIAAVDAVLPGVDAQIIGSALLVPPDLEEALGASEGDLMGGEIAPDQMLDFRPWNGNSGARTPLDGFYLAGPSSPAGVLGTCAGGLLAARALLADREAGR